MVPKHLWLPLLTGLIFLTAWNRGALPRLSGLSTTVPAVSAAVFSPGVNTIPSSLPSPTPTVTLTGTGILTPTVKPECSPNDTRIGGIISGTIQGWYCIAEEDLIVPAGETLAIGDSTHLFFAPGRRMIVAGRLETSGKHVAFKSIDQAGWDGLQFEPSAGGSVCNYCKLSEVRASRTALTIKAPITFQYGELRDMAGATAISSSVPFTLSNVIISNVGTGLHLSGQTHNPFRATYLTLDRCRQGIVNQGQTLTLDNSILTGCDVAISTLSATTVVSYSLFYGHRQDFVTEPGAQLVQGLGVLNEPPKFANYTEYRLRSGSPAVNAADPLADYSQEQGYNGNRADLGAYGNTWYAPERPPADQVTAEVDPPLLTGHPGETITYTLRLKNKGDLSDNFSIHGVVSRGREFYLEGLGYDHRMDDYHEFVGMEPNETHPMEIAVKIPTYVPADTVNITSIYVGGVHGAPPAELELTTVVSSPTTIERVSHVGLSVQDVSIQNTYAYLAAGVEGLHVLDLSHPITPTEIGVYAPVSDPLWIAREVEVTGNYAYVAAGQAGLRILDVSDPTAPLEVGVYQSMGSAEKISLANDYAYITWENCTYTPCRRKLHTVDISNPIVPVGVNIYNASSGSYAGVNDVTLAGNYAYLVADEGLQIMDVSDPTAWVELGAFPDTGRAYTIVVVDGYAYIATGERGLVILDISDPWTPVEIGSFKTSATNLVVVNHYIYLADGSPHPQLIDVSDPTAPVEIAGTYDIFNNAQNVRGAGPYAYVAAASAGLRIVDLSNPLTPRLAGTYGAPGYAQAVAVANGYAYVADGYSGLRIFDVSQPLTPVEVGFYNQRGGTWNVTVKDTRAYVIFGACDYTYVRYYGRQGSCQGDLAILDVSNPAAPHEVGIHEIAEAEGKSRWSELEISGNYAYLTDGTGSLHILDITQPTPPKEIALPDPKVADFALTNGYLYLLSPYNYTLKPEGGLTSESYLDILDPVSLTKVGSYSSGFGLEVTVVGRLAYIHTDFPCMSVCTDIEYGWHIVDVSNPTRPITASTTYRPVQAQAATIEGHYAYLADGKAGLRILDVSDPLNPLEVDAFGASGFAFDVAVADGYIYLANGSDGLHILRYNGQE